MSPTALSMKALRSRGYLCDKVEQWNPFAKVRRDAFEVIDILAIHDEIKGVIGVQATTTDHISHRINKALANKYLPTWLKAGNQFVVHGWQKKGARYRLSVRGIHLKNGRLKVGTELEPEADDGDAEE